METDRSRVSWCNSRDAMARLSGGQRQEEEEEKEESVVVGTQHEARAQTAGWQFPMPTTRSTTRSRPAPA